MHDGPHGNDKKKAKEKTLGSKISGRFRNTRFRATPGVKSIPAPRPEPNATALPDDDPKNPENARGWESVAPNHNPAKHKFAAYSENLA